MAKPKNPNKRSPADKEKQRSEGGEIMKKHGTAKERARKRNRIRAAKKRAAKPIEE